MDCINCRMAATKYDIKINFKNTKQWQFLGMKEELLISSCIDAGLQNVDQVKPFIYFGAIVKKNVNYIGGVNEELEWHWQLSAK